MKFLQILFSVFFLSHVAHSNSECNKKYEEFDDLIFRTKYLRIAISKGQEYSDYQPACKELLVEFNSELEDHLRGLKVCSKYRHLANYRLLVNFVCSLGVQEYEGEWSGIK